MAKIQDYINKVQDPDTRRAVQKVLELMRTDMATNKAVFDAHYHTNSVTAPGTGFTVTLTG